MARHLPFPDRPFSHHPARITIQGWQDALDHKRVELVSLSQNLLSKFQEWLVISYKYCQYKNTSSLPTINEDFVIDASRKVSTVTKSTPMSEESEMTFDEWSQAWKHLLPLIQKYLNSDYDAWHAHYNLIHYAENRTYDIEIRNRCTFIGDDPGVLHKKIWKDLELCYLKNSVRDQVQEEIWTMTVMPTIAATTATVTVHIDGNTPFNNRIHKKTQQHLAAVSSVEIHHMFQDHAPTRLPQQVTHVISSDKNLEICGGTHKEDPIVSAGTIFQMHPTELHLWGTLVLTMRIQVSQHTILPFHLNLP
ncbi:hypothetical protein FA15DRAFT_660585 [Coprinopsis marcescibilis]|uniref:Uncharacterized protein n=1 Tax=Coprinopsis marcescibilis TaxID=230819 RepID=A0A5C3KEQ5_COPMA|nr:hypothetical protein FA15DRAFT_660585 [Coprinopsis marcescibilis]